MRTKIDPLDEGWEARGESFQRFFPAAGETFFLPDLVEAPRVAAVAPNEVDTPDPKPTRDPDLDRMGFGKGRAGARLR